jgi:hypothetical protein
LFSRWYTDLRQGKHVVVVVVRATGSSRHTSPDSWRKGKRNGNAIDVYI